jgi:hypothetical protein
MVCGTILHTKKLLHKTLGNTFYNLEVNFYMLEAQFFILFYIFHCMFTMLHFIFEGSLNPVSSQKLHGSIVIFFF